MCALNYVSIDLVKILRGEKKVLCAQAIISGYQNSNSTARLFFAGKKHNLLIDLMSLVFIIN